MRSFSDLVKNLGRFAAALAIAAAVLCTLAAAPARAQNIEAIRVEGNQRVEPETVISYMAVGVGDPFDDSRVDASLKSLFATGLFADVAVRREGNVLVVRVVENPIINRLAFEGNQRIKDEELEAEVQLRPRTVYTRAKVQSDVARILELYRRNGRFAAAVEPKVIQQEQNRVDLIFEINEGEETSVSRITFVGNRVFSDSELRGVIRTKESAWYRFLSSDDTYDPDRLSFDRELLRRFYLSEGYADVAILSATADLSRDRKSFFITFTVEEGERYTFGDVRVKSSIPDLDTAELVPDVTTYTGDWYNADKVESSIQAMTDTVGNLGYAFVEVRPDVERHTEERTIDLVYEVDQGPRVYVERINIEGNVRTLDRVLRREFKIAEGDAFSTAKLRRSEQRIRNLDFFEKVEITTDLGSAPDKAVINVAVEEKSTGALTFGLGVSSFDGLLGDISLTERNLLGKGQSLSLNLTLSGKRQEIDLSFTEPAFLEKDNLSAGFDIFNKTTDYQDESSYDQESLGFGLRMGYPLTENLQQNLRYILRRDEISDVDPSASLLIRSQEGTAVSSIVGQEFFYDRLDNRINPTEGYSLSFSQDLAGLGGDVHYLRTRVAADGYYEFAQDWVGSLRVTDGYIFGLGDDVRITDAFFLGGGSLRGFKSAGVGPRDAATTDALGGKASWTASAELTYPIGLPRELGVLGRAFVDAGAAWSTDLSGPNIADSASPRVGVGLGITYVSPVGPLKLDFTFPVVREDFDEKEYFRFSFGTSF